MPHSGQNSSVSIQQSEPPSFGTACLRTPHLLPWYKRGNGRPRCPGTAPSLSDSWCCQESLPLLSTDLLAKTGSSTEAPPPPPCPPVSLVRENSADICSFLPPAISKPPRLHYCCSPLQSQPASLSLPEYKLSNLFFQEGD